MATSTTSSTATEKTGPKKTSAKKTSAKKTSAKKTGPKTANANQARSKGSDASATSGASPRSAAAPETQVACNLALVVGELVTEPELRTIAGGTKILSFSLTVRRPGERTTSVPLTWFDPPAHTKTWTVGMRLAACGPIVRRFYQYGGGTGSRTEIEVVRATPTTKRVSTKKIIAGIADEVSSVLEAVTG